MRVKDIQYNNVQRMPYIGHDFQNGDLGYMKKQENFFFHIKKQPNLVGTEEVICM